MGKALYCQAEPLSICQPQSWRHNRKAQTNKLQNNNNNNSDDIIGHNWKLAMEIYWGTIERHKPTTCEDNNNSDEHWTVLEMFV